MAGVRACLGKLAILALVALVAGCAVVPLPKTMATREQSAREQNWDLKDCQAEAGYRTGYSPNTVTAHQLVPAAVLLVDGGRGDGLHRHGRRRLGAARR